MSVITTSSEYKRYLFFLPYGRIESINEVRKKSQKHFQKLMKSNVSNELFTQNLNILKELKIYSKRRNIQDSHHTFSF